MSGSISTLWAPSPPNQSQHRSASQLRVGIRLGFILGRNNSTTGEERESNFQKMKEKKNQGSGAVDMRLSKLQRLSRTSAC